MLGEQRREKSLIAALPPVWCSPAPQLMLVLVNQYFSLMFNFLAVTTRTDCDGNIFQGKLKSDNLSLSSLEISLCIYVSSSMIDYVVLNIVS